MATKPEMHEQDVRMLHKVARELTGWRVMQRLTREELGERIGRSEAFVQDMERGVPVHQLSGLQIWASAFDLRVEPRLHGMAACSFENTTATEQMEDEVATLYQMSREFAAWTWVRLWIVGELALHRHRLGISAAEMGERLGLTRGSVTAWELNGVDPVMAKLCSYARALGGRIMVDLIERQDYNLHRGTAQSS